MKTLEITRPDDWHAHLRDGAMLRHTVEQHARYFGRAIVMPNLVPPVVTVEDARAYRDRIRRLRPHGSTFEPLMTLYLCDRTTPALIREAAAVDVVHAFKLYPAHATTNSAAGIADMEDIYPLLEAMAEADIPLLVHGESTDPSIDIFDRETAFIDRYLQPIVERLPELRVVLEHITTRHAVEFVACAPANVAATITAHHLLFNRNDLLVGGLRSPYYCLPILKSGEQQAALIGAALSGDPSFFLGTDSAPHPRSAKEDVYGCAAGSFTAHAAIELYAEVFEAGDALDRLEAFASHYGPDFYGLPRNQDTIRLVRDDWQIPEQLPLGEETVIPIRSGGTVAWRVEDSRVESTDAQGGGA